MTITLSHLVIALLICLVIGGLFHFRGAPVDPAAPRPVYYTYASWSPAALILIVLLVLLVMGRLR